MSGDRKHGRHSRGASNKLQKMRTERNKRLRQERHARRMARIAARNKFRAEHGGLTPAQYAKAQGLLPKSQRVA
jgi:hypothetical protein